MDLHVHVCSVCGIDAKDKRTIYSKAGKDKNLAILLKKYADIEVTNEPILPPFLCRSCHDKLLTIDSMVTSFKSLHAQNKKPLIDITNKSKKCVPLKPKVLYGPETEVNKNTKVQSAIDHEYSLVTNEKSVLAKKKKGDHNKSRINNNILIPHISEHDHTDAITDLSLFSFPNFVSQYFQNNDHLSSKNSVLTEIELNDIQKHLLCNDVNVLSDKLLDNKKTNDALVRQLINQAKHASGNMNNTKHGFISVLMRKEPEHLEKFDWSAVCSEFMLTFPILFQLVVAVMLPIHEKPQDLSNFMPRIGLIYSVMMQARNPSLSLTQRMMSLLFIEKICDQKVYDRLQPVGVCLSYQSSLHLLELLGGTFNREVINAVVSKKTVRFIGDNVNFATGIYEQHFSGAGKTKEMHHAFANAILVNNFSFTDTLSDLSPQKEWDKLAVTDFLISPEEMCEMKTAYITIIAKVLSRFLPCLSFCAEVVPQLITGKHSKFLTEKTIVVPLETLPLNEQKYDDVVKILEYYETVIKDVHHQASIDLNNSDCYHIGGDQLTRERFSGAKRLRAGADNITDSFGHLKPITFEFFHLLMNFLKLFNHYLYDERSIQEVGTMKCELSRIMRTNFEEDVNKAYDADKDFTVSFVDAHIVEMALEFFGMDTMDSKPLNHIPPDFANEDEKKNWVFSTIGAMIEPIIQQSNITGIDLQNGDVIDEASIITIPLSDGKLLELKIHKKIDSYESSKPTDRIFNYASIVLHLGMVYKELLDVCKLPDRKRLLRMMKQCLVIFKSKGNLNKYAVEILRFLMQQNVLLSEKRATKTLYSMFVNTKGRIDTHIPADLQMEYLVKLTKKHIKHMFSNKTAQNISKKTSALAYIDSICDTYDKNTNVKVRCNQHKHPSYHDDEVMMIQDLRSIRPFKLNIGRSHDTFRDIKRSVSEYLDPVHFQEWILKRIKMDATDLAI